MNICKNESTKLTLEIKTDPEQLLNYIKILVDKKFELIDDKNGLIITFFGKLKLDFTQESLILSLQPYKLR